MRPGPARLSLLLIGLFLAIAHTPASAADWYVVPRVALGAKYDSNINFNDRQRSDFIFNVSPSVDVNYTTEITKLTGRLALDGLVYVRNGNLDTINQYYSLLGQHKVAPRLAVTFSGGYILDSTLNEESITSGFLMNRTRRQAFQAAPGLNFNLTERALLQLGYAYNQVDYQDPDYNDFSAHRMNLGLNYLLKNAKTTLTGTILGRFTDYPSIGNSYRNLGTYAGLEHKFTEEWSLALSGGLNFNWFSSQTAVLGAGFFPDFIQVRQATEETFTVSPFFKIVATRRWTKTNLTFGYTVDQSPSAGGTINQFHSGYAGVSYDISERLKGGFRGSLYYGNSTSPGSDYQNLVLYLSPELRYQLTEKITVNSSYRYGWRDDLVGGRTTDRHLVWLYLSYSNPLHYKK